MGGLPRKMSTLLVALFLYMGGATLALAQYASLIMDANTGRVLYESNADVIHYPASLTKMMTLYLLFESLQDGRVSLDERIQTSAHAAAQPPTKLGLLPGQTITVENAVLAVCTKSANDMAAAIAERVGGSEDAFATMMTAKAHDLGMANTYFVNASGLPDPNQVTTARDMSILALALIHDYPQYYHFFGTERFYYGGAVHANHNHLLGSYTGMDGIKTGYTRASGFNLVASALRDDRRLIGVVLGARSPATRGLIMTDLLDQAFDGNDVITASIAPDEPSAAIAPGIVPVSAVGGWEAGRRSAVARTTPSGRVGAGPACRTRSACTTAVKSRGRQPVVLASSARPAAAPRGQRTTGVAAGAAAKSAAGQGAIKPVRAQSAVKTTSKAVVQAPPKSKPATRFSKVVADSRR